MSKKSDTIRQLNLATIGVRRKLGMWTGKRRDVVRVVCEKMGVPYTPDKHKHLAILLRFGGVAKPKKSDGFLPPPPAATDTFLQSYEWRRLRMVVLTKRGARCECCGATPADGVRMNVDHIKPRRLFPELALTESNLQVLCDVCNHGKGNWDQTDWRQAPTTPAKTVDVDMSLDQACRVWNETKTKTIQ